MLRYSSPASDWNEALPLGNGRLGAMVYGGVFKEILRLNEESVWYGGPMDRTPVGASHHLDDLRKLIRAGKHRDAEDLVRKHFLASPKSMRHYEPLGTCTIEFQYPLGKAEEDDWEDYERALDLARAETSVRYMINDTQVHREAIATHADNVIALHITADKEIIFRISLTRMSDVEWEVNEFLDSIEVIDRNIVLHATPGGKDSNSMCLAAGAQIRGAGTIRIVGRELEVTAKEALIVLAAHTQYRYNDVQQAALSDLSNALQLGQEKLWQQHIVDWQSHYGRMSLKLSPDNRSHTTPQRLTEFRDPGLIALYHAYARYLLLSCSRPDRRALPANLQGIWNPSFQPPWGSKFTININLQMNYWGAHVSHLSDCELPLFDLLERMSINGRRTASEVWGCRGWCAHHCTDIFGDTDCQDRWMPASLWPLGGAWLCTHIWEHYQFTGNQALLTRMAPVLEGSVEFLLDFLVEDSSGKYLVPTPSLSPENTFLQGGSGEKGVFCEGSTMDIEIVRQVFTHFLLISSEVEHLCKRHDHISAVKLALAKLPPIMISPRTGTIQEWGLNDFEELELGHRHISHLYALHPASSITTSSDFAIVEAARKTLVRRLKHGGGHTGWSRAWLINFWARLRKPMECQENIQALLKDSTLPNMLDNHPPFQIDGNFGGAAGIVECLVQSHEQVKVPDSEKPIRLIRLLPSCPAMWEEGKIRGVRCRGGFELDFGWNRGRVLEPVYIRSFFGHAAVVTLHDVGSDAQDSGVQVKVPAAIGHHAISYPG